MLQYLLGTLERGITFDGMCGQGELLAYVDADYATDVDKRRSVSGGIVMLGGAAISWFSRMQKVSALSTSEAEYIALSEGVKEILFLQQVHSFMGPRMDEYCINVFEDNEGALKMANNPISSHRTKHIDVRHHFIRQHVQEGTISIVHIGTEEQHADVLTKALDRTRFERHVNYIMNIS